MSRPEIWDNVLPFAAAFPPQCPEFAGAGWKVERESYRPQAKRVCVECLGGKGERGVLRGDPGPRGCEHQSSFGSEF